ncbi:MAG: hypothetical protein IJI36_02470 [Kiritimatiellae bacterium]|nr:hypothetical protein [Kiritimatiellia bacterium]
MPAQAATERTTAECYALELDSADATNGFRIVSIELGDGKVKVEREPKTNRWTGAGIRAMLRGGAGRTVGGGLLGTVRPTIRFF